MAFGGFKKNFQRSESDKADPFNMPVADAGSDEMQMYQKKITKKKFRYFVRCGFWLKLAQNSRFSHKCLPNFYFSSLETPKILF